METESFRKCFVDSARDSLGPISNEKKQELESSFIYSDLHPDDRLTVEAVLTGNHRLEQLPQLKPRVIRVFISSTFTDTEEERNALLAKVYPKLKEYCRECHGIDFLAIDMRWGVPDRANDDNTINDFCIDEIAQCQRDSIGPNFVAFLGQKYGYVALPSQIPRAIFESIVQVLTTSENENDLDLLRIWYKLDFNSLKHVYVLQRISNVSGQDASLWNETKEKIQNVLYMATAECPESPNMNDFIQEIHASVSEHEINAGIGKVQSPTDRQNRCLVFTRTISELGCFLDRAKAYKFVDLEGSTNQFNDVKHLALKKLRDEKVLPTIASMNVFHDTVLWSEPHGIEPDVHKHYLEKVCSFFYQKMRLMIDENVDKQNQMHRDELYEEVLQQWNIVKELSDNFMGRQGLLKIISSYILGESHQPFVLYGESGHGKTGIIAKASTEILNWLKASNNNINATIIVRLCGTTPASSNIRQLLHSLCHQIAFVTNRSRLEVPDEYHEMKKYFRDVLQSGEFRGLVVIFLDAINELSSDDCAHNLDWLPPKISNNVKIIVSSSKDHVVLNRLQSKISENNNFVEVEPLELSQCCMILNALLDKSGRMVSFEQCKIIKEAFSVCASPLYTKLLFEEVVQWKSYTNLNSVSLPLCVTDCINNFFDKVEIAHGKITVVHALSYITASRTGLSSAELHDIMSLDDTVLNSIFTISDPPLRRIPPNLLSRILHCIKGFLCERETDEATVLFWSHKQFNKVAEERYLSDLQHKRYIHSVMADYFLGTWGRMKSKPFEYGDSLMKKLDRPKSASTAIRYIPEQPLVFSTFNTTERFNYRKLNQLPYHLFHSKRLLELNSKIYFNYEWLYTKLRACSVQRVIVDLNMSSEREVVLLTDAIRMSEAALENDSNLLGVELSGRLLPHYNKFPNIRRLIGQCDFESMQKCPIVPNWQVYTSPGGPLQYVCEANHNIKSELDVGTIQYEDTVLLTAKPYHGTQLRIWDVTQGEPHQNLTLPSGTRIYPTPDGKLIHLFKNSEFLQTYRLDSGDMVGNVEFGHGNLAHVAVSNKYVAFTLESSTGPIIIDTEAKRVIQRFQYKCQAVAISEDERYLACNSSQAIAVHEFPMMVRKCTVPCSALPDKIVFTRDPSKIYVMLQTRELQRLSVNFTHQKGKLTGFASDIEMKDFMLSHNQEMILMRSSRCLVLFDTSTDDLLHRIRTMPPGIFMEHLSTFKDAHFTPNDCMIVAARHTYLGVWDVKTAQPLRLFHSSVTPILRLYTCMNKLITLLYDNSIQVWNMDNLDADVQHCNAVIKGKVTAMAAASKGSRVICAGADVAEAVILDLKTGEADQILHHTDEVGISIDSVLISPSGNIAATRVANSDVPDHLEPWHLLKEDKLWSLETGKVIRSVSNNRYITFSSDDSRLTLLPCRSYSNLDWSIISYDIVVIDPSGGTEEYILELPEGDLLGQPILVGKGSFLVFILQKSYLTTNSSIHSSSTASSLYLCVYSFEKVWKGVKYITLNSLWTGAHEEDNFIDVRDIDDDNVLLIFARGVGRFHYQPDGTLDCSRTLSKGAMVYSVSKGNVLHHMNNFMCPESDLNKTMLSSHGSILLDDQFQFFYASSGSFLYKLKGLENALGSNQSVRLLLDGKYAAVLSVNRRKLFIHRTNDGARKARIFIHGTALHMEVCQDDRTLVLGCKDGRIAIFTLVLDHADHVKDVTRNLPSRKASYKSPEVNPVLGRDISNVQKNDGELKTMAVLTRRDIVEKRRRANILKAMGTAVMLTKEYNKIQTSAACSLQ